MLDERVDAYRRLIERRFAEAQVLCERLLASTPGDAELRGLREIARQACLTGALDAAGHFQIAASLQRVGLLAEAVEQYRAVLRLVPDSAEAYNNLGSALQALGRDVEARSALRRALEIRPDYPRALSNLAGLRLRMGDAEGARHLAARAVELQADYAEAWINLGAAQRASGESSAAVASCRRAIELRPGSAAAYYNLARATRDCGDVSAALGACERALKIDPAGAGPRVLHAILLEQLGRHGESVAAFERLTASLPASPDLAIGLARELLEVSRLDLAAPLLARSLARAPTHAALRIEAARCERRLRRFAAARALLEPLLGGSSNAEAWYEIGLVLLNDASERCDQAQIGAAIECLRRSVALDDSRTSVHLALGLALVDLKRGGEAVPHLERVLREDPRDASAAAALLELRAAGFEWHDYDALCEVVRAGVDSGVGLISPIQTIVRFDDPALAQRVARQFVGSIGLAEPRPRLAAHRRRGRLRIGYVSQDFHDHPVAQALAPVLEAHDRSRVEVIGVSTAADDGSAISARARAACDRLMELAMVEGSRFESAVRELELDILVDLGGFTAGARPRALAARLAPVQACYLGYATTTGAPWIDYLLADAFVIPPDLGIYYDERVIRLPDTFMAGERPVDAARAPGDRAAAGLPEDATVFCNFNQPFRLTPQTIDTFLQVLALVPDGVLWLRNPGAEAAVRLFSHAESLGIAKERIVFAKYVPSRDDNLRRLVCADLFLDGLPYNAHTTARDALGIGVPVLTRAGSAFAARVAGSLLTSLGVGELIVKTPAQFIDQAVSLGRDAHARESLRARILAGREHSSAFNPRLQARQLETAFQQMHDGVGVESGLEADRAVTA